MKRIGLFLLMGVLLLMFSACRQQATDNNNEPPASSSTENYAEPLPTEEGQNANADESETEGNAGKILVAYFSSAGNIVTDETVSGNIGQGNTKLLAEMIKEQVGGDLFFIETVDKYPANYRDAIGVAMQELRNNTRPALASHVENMDEYDMIFLGYPNWWGTLPQAILTFIEEYDFSGKTVIPFCTYEDSGIGRSVKDLENMLPNTTLLNEFSISEHDLGDSEDDVKQWISDLNLSE